MGGGQTPWRFGRAFTPAELAAELSRCASRSVTVPSDDAMADTGPWNRYYSRAIVAKEGPGRAQPGGAFDRARTLLTSYAFSDPRIVRGHFDGSSPLLGRTILLELCAFGLSYLCGVRVARVRETSDAQRTVLAFRYDTLEGHIERGGEWFVLTKDHPSGAVEFRIEATWRPGTFPNWWSRVGFTLVGARFQRAWHRLAYLRLRTLLDSRGLPPLPRGRRLMHIGVPVEPPQVGLIAAVPAPPELAEREVHEAGA